MTIALIMMNLLGTPAAGAGTGSTSAASEPDPYLWLEEVEGERALAWARAQNQRSLAELQADPRFARFEADARRILEARDRIADPVLFGGTVYNYWQDDRHVRGLLRRSDWASYASGAAKWEPVLDIDALSAHDGKTWVTGLPDCLPPEYQRCLVVLSEGGKDAVIVREFDTVSRQFVEDGFTLAEAKHSVEWLDRDTLLIGTDWGPDSLTASGYPYIIKRWRRGEPLSAAREIFRGTREDVGVSPERYRDRDGTVAVVLVRNETFFESSAQLVDGDRLVPLPLPRRSQIESLWSGQLVVSLQEDWVVGDQTLPSGSVVSFALEPFRRTGTLDVKQLYQPGPRAAFQAFRGGRSVAYVLASENVTTRAYRYVFNDGQWRQLGALELPLRSQVTLGHVTPDDDRAFVYAEGFTTPRSLYVAQADGTLTKLAETPPKFDASRLVVDQFEAVSKDGTKVPYFIVRPRDLKIDGTAPTLLYGYGGFQISMTPTYSGTLGRLWLEGGGVYVLANIRGGGEFGPAWHQAGLKTHRQRIFDDFAAVAEDLIARRITSPRRLGIMGGSNGGLLMGVELTQRPELWNAVVIQVPLLDMLRYDQMLAGASWVDEYGSPNVPEERAFLQRISPYSNLKPGTKYPPPFFVTSTKDDRVHPGHARKMAAKMADMGLPFYYYENIDGGHAAATDQRERAKRIALEFTYLSRRLKD
jgi:prolyl oligopeptidase